MKLFFSLVISFLFTLYLIPHLCALAFRFKMVDNPDGKIKKHKKPTPYLGGVAVYFGFITALALTFPFENQMFLFLVGSTLLLFIGLLDDLIVMRPAQKFLGQIIATFCFLKAGFYLKHNFFFNNFWNIPISFLWILVVINAFNLIDVMDGLATIVAICASVSFLIFSIYLHHISLSILIASLLGALIAFFLYNKPEAKIYLGDAGSLFIGGFFATVPFLFSWSDCHHYAYLTPIIILAIPLLEVGTLILVRTFKGIPFYQGSPDHFSIYLQKKGWSKHLILFYALLFSMTLFGVAYLFLHGIFYLPGLFAITTILLAIWYAILFF